MSPQTQNIQNRIDRDRSGQRGFTAIELLMAIAVVGIAFGTIYKTFEQLNRSYSTENVKAGVQQSARVTVELMVQDIRLAGLDPLGTAGAGIKATSDTSIHFTTDANFDGDDDDTFEDISYALTTGKLEQTNHLGETATLLDAVEDLKFTYLNSDDQTTSLISEIRSVMISLTVRKPAGRDEPVSRTYTTKVRCRNL